MQPLPGTALRSYRELRAEPSMTKKYSLGIDLGTSNSCISLCEVSEGVARGIEITQVVAPEVIGEKPLLPSALYIPATGE